MYCLGIFVWRSGFNNSGTPSEEILKKVICQDNLNAKMIIQDIHMLQGAILFFVITTICA